MSDDARLREFLNKEAAHRRRGAIITLVVGLALAAAIAIYMGVIFSMFLGYLGTPKKLVEVCYGRLAPEIPKLISQVEAFATTEAVPLLVGTGKEYLIARAPDLREKAEELVTERTEKILKEVSAALSEHVGDLIAQHKDKIDALVKEFGDPERQEDMRLTLEAAFEEVARKELDARLPDLIEGLQKVHEELKVLADAKDLTEEQELIRDLVILARECRDRFMPRELPKLGPKT